MLNAKLSTTSTQTILNAKLSTSTSASTSTTSTSIIESHQKSFFSLKNKFFYTIAIFLSIISGCGIAGFTTVVGIVCNYFVFVNQFTGEFTWALLWMGIMLVIGIFLSGIAFFQCYLYKRTMYRVVQNIKMTYFKSVLYSNNEDFGDIKSLLTTIETGFGDGLGNFIRTTVQLGTCVGVAYWHSWHLALPLTGLILFVFIWTEIFTCPISKYMGRENLASKKAKDFVEERIDGIHIVQAYNAEELELTNYKNHLKNAQKPFYVRNFINAISLSIVYVSIFIYFFLGTWYGAYLYNLEIIVRPGDILVPITTIVISAYPSATIKTNFLSIISAIKAYKKIKRIFINFDIYPTYLNPTFLMESPEENFKPTMFNNEKAQKIVKKFQQIVSPDNQTNKSHVIHEHHSSYINVLKIMNFNWRLLVLGIVLCFVNGMGVPMYAKCNGEYYAIYEQKRDQVNNDYIPYALIITKYYLIAGGTAAIAMLFYVLLFGKIGESLKTKLRITIFNDLLQEEDILHVKKISHDAKNLIEKETPAFVSALDLRFAHCIAGIFALAVAFATSVQKDVVFGFLASSCFFIMPLLQYVAARKMQKYQKIATAKNLVKKVQERASNKLKDIKEMNCQHEIWKIYKEAYEQQEKYDIEAIKYQAINFASVNGLQQITVSVAYLIGFCTIKIGLTVEPLLVQKITQTLLPSAANLTLLSPHISCVYKARKVSTKIMKFLKLETPKIVQNGRDIQIPHGEIRFENVSAKGNKLENLNLNISSSSKIAIVDSDDSSVPSVIRLLERFVNPDSGKILIDDQDIQLINKHDLRSKLGLVDPVLFSGTIAENISYGPKFSQNADMDAIISIAKEAGIDQAIALLPEGYGTNISLYEKSLSKDLHHRIALARALYRHPKILLINEHIKSNTNIDKEFYSINKESTNRTCIYSTNNLNIIQKIPIDKIIYIEDGTIVGESHSLDDDVNIKHIPSSFTRIYI